MKSGQSNGWDANRAGVTRYFCLVTALSALHHQEPTAVGIAQGIYQDDVVHECAFEYPARCGNS